MGLVARRSCQESAGARVVELSVMGRISAATFVSLLLLAQPAAAQLDAWAEGTDEHDDGATRDFYNRGAGLAWEQLLGDWRDQDGALHGERAWANFDVEDTDTERYVEVDVTALVQAQLAGTARNLGFFLRPLGSGGPIDFATRESAEGRRPELVVATPGGEVRLPATADTHLRRSTYQCAGDSEEMRVGSDANALVAFDLSSLTEATSATLRLFTTRQFGGGLNIGVFEVATGEPGERRVRQGLAAAFDRDEGIADHDDVIFVEDFESADWPTRWTAAEGRFDTVSDDASFGFEPLVGSAVRVLLPEGENTALNLRFDFQRERAFEPDEVYFRYYLRFGSDWDQSVDGGKLPGISGTYGRAGWGGRRSDGTNGWSARGAYRRGIPRVNNPLAGRTAIGSYIYHADQETTYGDVDLWTQGWGPEGRGGILENERWVSLETYVRMNTPGEPDGIVRAWVDGVLAYERTDLRFRTVDTLSIERIWMNIYHGGTAVSPADQHSFIDNVVVARSYIGPMGNGTGPMADAGVPSEDAGSPDHDAGNFPRDAGAFLGDAGAGPSPEDESGGCSCRAVNVRELPGAGLLVFVLWAWRRRR